MTSQPTRNRPFKQVDVFTATAYLGNPLAVVLDGSGLSTQDMQRFARWTNLSETTFLLPASPQAAAQGADYQVRIFTPGYEMPFAGHPTLGSCHAWLEHGGVPQKPGTVVQQCQVGLVNISLAAGRPAFAAPALKRRDATPALVHALADALGLPHAHVVASQHLNNGPFHFGLLIDNSAVLLALEPDSVKLKTIFKEAGISGVGVATSTPTQTGQASLEVRFFFDHGKGIGEDPVTGSFNASQAQWLIADRHMPAHYIAKQGACVGVQGRVYINQDASGQVWVGGDSVTCVDGVVRV